MKTAHFLIFFSLSLYAFAEEKVEKPIFQLVKSFEKSSLDRQLAVKLATTGLLDPEDTSKIHPYYEEKSVDERIFDLFRPIKGVNRVYRFRAALWAHSIVHNKKAIFHESLILEVSPEGLITGGYSYTEEWAEPHLVGDVFEVGVENLSFNKLHNVSQLQLKPLMKDYGSIDFAPLGYIDRIPWDTPLAKRSKYKEHNKQVDSTR